MKEYECKSYGDYLYNYMFIDDKYIEENYYKENIDERFNKSLDEFLVDINEFWKYYEQEFEYYQETRDERYY